MLRFVLLLMIIASPLAAFGSPVSDMESNLIHDKNLKIVYRIKELPVDIINVLYAASKTKEIANYGEDYNKTDAINPEYPMVQHQFSMYSDKSAAIIFRKGGFVSGQYLVVLNREKPSHACAYRIVPRADTKGAILELLKEKKKYMDEYIFDFCQHIKVGS